jgi:hypothetical protein
MVCWFGVCACMLILCIAFLFMTLDLIVDEFGEEEDFEEFKEDQGQATQGKPSKLVAYLYLSFTYACFQRLFMQDALFLIAITPL